MPYEVRMGSRCLGWVGWYIGHYGVKVGSRCLGWVGWYIGGLWSEGG